MPVDGREARVGAPASDVGHHVEQSSGLGARLRQRVEELYDGVVGVVCGDGTVFKVEVRCEVLEFHPSAWFQGVVNLAKEARPVFYGGSQAPAVDVVVLVCLDPVQLDVVYEEVDIGRHPGRLDGAEVVAGDGGAGV